MVAYRESIVRPKKGVGKCIRQTGGHGMYGHCVVEFAPTEPGEGYIFEDKTVGGIIPKAFVEAIDLGIREAARSGQLAGYEVVDFKATLVDGSTHEVDSSELAFKIAGSFALRDALTDNSMLLEPFMKVEITLPGEYIGDVIGNLNARRARVEGNEQRSGGVQAIQALCPLSDMFGYATDLRSRTQGRGTYTMQFDHYEQVSPAIASKMLGINNF